MKDFNYYCKHCKNTTEKETCSNCSNKAIRVSQRTKCTEPKSKDINDLCGELLKIILDDNTEIIIHEDCPNTHYQQQEQPGKKPTGDKGSSKTGLIVIIVIVALAIIGTVGYYL